ncbi:MAG: hypothetical protein ACK5N8_06140 [Alphaproteobacteria bacterium]
MKKFLSVLGLFCVYGSTFAVAQQVTRISMPIQKAETKAYDEVEEAYLKEVGNPANAPVVQKTVEMQKVDEKKDEGNKIDKDATLSGMIEAKAEARGTDRETWLDKVREDAKKELTSTKEDKKEEKSEETAKTESSSVTKQQAVSLKTMLDESKQGARRSNVSVFDVSGAMLRMTPQQIDEALTRRGYRKTREKFEIPNFIKWRKEDECRAHGVVGYERLAACVIKTSKKDNYEYLEAVSYSKFDSKENIMVNFTSNFTNNKSYKIIYTSEASNVKGNSQKAIYLRNIKIYDFWKQINQKYGVPDNKDEAIWGLGGNKPFMQATTGKLNLEDPMLRELDYTRMSREDQKFMNTGTYNF